MMDFEAGLRTWALGKLDGEYPENGPHQLRSVQIASWPGTDDTPPETWIEISGWGHLYAEVHVTPDLLTIAGELAQIIRDRESYINAPF